MNLKSNKAIDIIIPARMGSSRFPGKPMANICGIPMIEHVYKRCSLNLLTSSVYVATCDKEIYDHIIGIGGKAIMTSDRHTRCTSRTLEAVNNINSKADLVVMVQGDEPLLNPEMINEAVRPMLNNENIIVTNLTAPINSEKEFMDRNEIKVVFDSHNNALYFSREPIPTLSKNDKSNWYKQVCIIPFTRQSLTLFESLPEAKLEKAESIDMLRFLEAGYKVHMAPTRFDSYSVDTIEDLNKVEQLMKTDSVFKKYKK